MQRPSGRPKHHVRQKTAGPRPGAPRQRTPERQPPAIRPVVLVVVALALFVGLATVWLVQRALAPAEATVAPVAAKAAERPVMKPSKPERGQSAPARERWLEPGLAPEDSAGLFPGGHAELAASPEDPAAEIPEATSPPNPEDLETSWRNEGEEIADASDEGDEFDPEATDDELDELEELREIYEFDVDDREELMVPDLAGFEEEEALLEENDEDFRGRDDLAEFEHVAEDEPEPERGADS